MKYTIICLTMLLSFTSSAEDKKPAVTAGAKATQAPAAGTAKVAKPAKNSQVLDFDSDVIEGERKSPDLFLQLQVDTPNLDTLLYQRRNFNDFHNLEKNRRPVYRKATQ